jgi:hypothetical protein
MKEIAGAGAHNDNSVVRKRLSEYMTMVYQLQWFCRVISEVIYLMRVEKMEHEEARTCKQILPSRLKDLTKISTTYR